MILNSKILNVQELKLSHLCGFSPLKLMLDLGKIIPKDEAHKRVTSSPPYNFFYLLKLSLR